MESLNKQKEEKKKLIDFSKIGKVIKEHRNYYYCVLPITLVLTYLLMCCIPRYYSCSVVLAPESSDLSSASGGLSSAMSSLGLGGLSKLGDNDAISPDLYPDLLSSNDFIIKMFPIKVVDKTGKLSTTYYDYLKDHINHPWWDHVMLAVRMFFKPLPISHFKGTSKLDVFHMDKTQQDIAALISNNITCKIDQKTYSITITVEDQDPNVCALIADSTKQHLQNFITEYRTSKARNDYNYYTKLYLEAKRDYEKARRKYAGFSDANTDAMLQSVRSMTDDLENEMQLRYNVYTSVSAQRQAALAKIQERTPVFTTLESATVPIKPAGPKRVIFALALTIVVFVGMSMFFLRKNIC